MHFGITFLGRFACIKLNTKISSDDIDMLRDAYPELDIFPIGEKGLVRIEGVLPADIYMQSFKPELKIVLLKAKAYRMLAEADNLEQQEQVKHLQAEAAMQDTFAPLDDLPF